MSEALRWIALAQSGPDGVGEVAEALGAAESAEQAQLAALALARAGAFDALARALQDPRVAVRQAAVAALSTGRNVTAAGRLVDGAQGEPVPWLRRERVRTGLAGGAAVPDFRKIDDVGILGSILARWQSGDRAGIDVPWVASHLASPAAELAWRSCVLLRDRVDDVGVSDFDAALDHPSSFVVAQAALALKARGMPAPVDVVGLWRDDVPFDLLGVRALDDGADEDVERAALALALGSDLHALLAAVGRLAGSSNPMADSSLCAACRHPAPRVRAAAVRALSGRSWPGVRSAYDGVVRYDPDLRERVAAVWTVGRRKELEALDLLLSWQDIEELDVRASVIEALVVRVRKSARARRPDVRSVLELASAGSDGDTATLARDGLSRFAP